MRYLAKVSYRGTAFCGWQKQTVSKLPSIEESIEKVLSRILSNNIKIYGSGRTDAGVHALGQTFHFDSPKELDVSRIAHSLNELLPEDIRILSLEKVSDDFHARFNAKSKTYLYKILVQGTCLKNSIDLAISSYIMVSFSTKGTILRYSAIKSSMNGDDFSGRRNSSACAAFSNSMAKIFSTLLTMTYAFVAAFAPILTWSSCPCDDSIESDEEGIVKVLFWFTIEAAVYCGIMNPEFKPGTFTRKDGSSLLPAIS